MGVPGGLLDLDWGRGPALGGSPAPITVAQTVVTESRGL